MEQVDIFSIMYPTYKITKPIRLIEMFAGYGSQALALKYLGVKFEHWKICEWAIKSIQAYKDAHYTNIDIEFNKDRTKEEIVEQLFKLGVSSDYNNPLTKEQLNRYKLEDLKTILKNIGITKNLVNICNVKGKDLEIVDTDKYDYILTYSFPCQDLSLAGLGKGMARDSGTRSGMLWEVERILDECENLPQILLMENVPEVKGTNNVKYFNEWQLKLESLGYKSYHQNLIATDYGIPQTRNRCFMISILGDYSYSFPQPIPLKLKLKDMLEDNVDEKYYLSENAIKGMLETNYQQGKYENRVQKDICSTIMARDCRGAKCVEVLGTYQYSKSDNFMKGKDRFQIGKQTSDTIQTTPKEGVIIKGNYSPSKHNASRIVDENGLAPTVMENHGTVTAIQTTDLRIRKLIPKECFRLMGVKDEDYERIAKNQSNSSLYHLAGDSIEITCLMAILGELLNIDWKERWHLWNIHTNKNKLTEEE